MASSRKTTDWGLLCLRLAVGSMAIVHGWGPVSHVSSWNPSHLHSVAFRLALGILEMLCGGFVILGLWLWPAVLGILIILGIPLVRTPTVSALFSTHLQTLFRMLVTLACALAGPGKASVSK